MDDIEKEPFLAPMTRERELRSKTRLRWSLALLGHILLSLCLTIAFINLIPLLRHWWLGNSGAGSQNSIALIDQSVLGIEIDDPEPHRWEQSIFRGRLGNSTGTDQAWARFLRWKGSRITREEAESLDLETIPLPGDARATIMSAWHNLHCINTVREFIYMYNTVSPEEFATKPHDHSKYLKEVDHAFHCLEVLRSSVVCQPDTNINALQWTSESREEYVIRSDSRRQCVKWEAFESWTRSRNFHGADLWKVDEPM